MLTKRMRNRKPVGIAKCERDDSRLCDNSTSNHVQNRFGKSMTKINIKLCYGYAM